MYVCIYVCMDGWVGGWVDGWIQEEVSSILSLSQNVICLQDYCHVFKDDKWCLGLH